MKLYETAVKKPVGTSLIFIGLVLIGLIFYFQLPVDLLPDIEMNVVSVMTFYPGAGAEDVETNVTRPLEDLLNTTENLKHIISRSKDGLSLILLEFEYGTNTDNAMNDVRDKLEMSSQFLPEGITDPMLLKFSADMMPVMTLSATADVSTEAMYKILDDQIVNPLNRIPGVGTVSISGAPQREIQVNVTPQKLEAYRISLEQIAQVIAAENVNVPAGNFDIGTQTYMLRLEGEMAESRDFNSLIVGNHQGKPIYLRDVATVIDTVKTRILENYTNGRRSASLVVQKQTGANSVAIAEAVKEQLPGLQKNLPPDIQIEVVTDTSDHIQTSINSLMQAILLALIVVGAVVLFFLGRWRATIIILTTIPISLIGSFIYLYVTGNTINIISLSSLSIAIGMVVDDAIVVLENITTHLERGSRPRQAAIYGTEEVSLSIIASTLTIVAVFLPMTLTTGLAGILFEQLGWMVTIIILLSLLIAMTLTPMMSSYMLRATKDMNVNKFDLWYRRTILPMLDNLDHGYAKLVNWAARKRWQTTGIIAAIFVGGVIICVLTLKTEFIPSADNNQIGMTIEMPTGTRVEIARAQGLKIQKMLREKYPEIEIISFSVGQADEDNLFASMRDNATHLMSYTLRLTKAAERKRSIFEIADEIRRDLSQMPELYRYEVQPGGGMASAMGGSYVDVDIFGHNLATTDRIAADLQAKLSEIKGLRDVTITRKDYRTEYQVNFDREKLALNGLTMSTAAGAIRNRINGLVMSQYREEGDEYDIRVRFDEKYRQSLEDIENILIYNPMGVGVRVRDLGTVIESSSLPQIDRRDRQRIVTVRANIYRRALNEVVEDIQKAINTTQIPPEISVDISGSLEQQQESFGDLTILLIVAVLLVYIVMASQFESLTYPFVIILSVPFAFIGSLLLLTITGIPLSIMAFIGLVMLVGIVVKNGIVLIDYINLNRERGMSIIKAIVDGGRSRLRPVLMTALTTIFGMVPLAIGTGQGSEIWRPLGVSIVGGMTFSTVVTLVLVPALYSIFGSYGVVRKRKKHREKLIDQTNGNNNGKSASNATI
ncbi:MAG: efflux RND transporter permease subunit [Bacteroidales bacterium]|nr:efflux RND transporter permease subunit [Bacteroidales bacterium]